MPLSSRLDPTTAVLVLAVALLTAAGLLAARQPRVEGEALRFEVHDLDGGIVGSSDPRFEGKLVLLDLWGTWCPPCLSEIPVFNDLHARYGDAGLLIVGMAFEREPDDAKRRAHLRAFASAHDVDYLVLDGGDIGDFERTLPQMRDVGGFPVEILIGRGGKVVSTRNGYGYSKRWARRLERELAKHLGVEPRGRD